MDEIEGTAEEERREGERRNDEKHETCNELDEVLHLAQTIGHRLASEIHGDAFDSVQKLNEILHDAHIQLMVVQLNLAKINPG